MRTRTPRPDELTRETFEFIAAVDEYKRRHMRSFLDDGEILAVAHELGWLPPGAAAGDRPGAEEVASFAGMREEYRRERGRLFPSWSELFELLQQLGYRRLDRDGDAA